MSILSGLAFQIEEAEKGDFIYLGLGYGKPIAEVIERLDSSIVVKMLATLGELGLLKDQELELFRKKGKGGDILKRYKDADGSECVEKSQIFSTTTVTVKRNG